MEEITLGPASQPSSDLNRASLSKPDVGLHRNMTVIMERLADAIDKLPINEQAVIGLRYNEELTFNEIGLVLDLTESKVEQLYRRAMTRLRIMECVGLA